MDGVGAGDGRAGLDGPEFFSRLLIALAPFPLFFGWIFLVAGIGIVFLLLGLAFIVVGISLRWSWKRLAWGMLAVLAGCSPILFLMVWVVLGLGN